MIYKTIDLCAGIGGIRRGFELTGHFQNVISAEIDESACKTYEHLFGDDPRNDLTSDEFKRKIKEYDYDVLLAGFPCQAFSSVGLQLGFEDTIKGTIFFDIARIIRETHPKVVFLENVENLIVHNKGQTFQTIIEVLEDYLHYKVIGSERNIRSEVVINRHAFLRNSKEFGLPQNRPRIYIAAFSREYFGSLVDDLPNMLPTGNNKTIYQSLRDILDSEVSPKYFLSSGYLDTLERHNQRQIDKGYGFGYRIVNSPDVKVPISNTLLATGGSGRERNLIIDTANGSRYAGMTVQEKKSPINAKNIRFMTPNEWGKLQGFIGYGFMKEDGTDGFSFPDDIADVQKYKQFGNSVSIPVIETMAEFIFKCITDMIAKMSSVEKKMFTLYGDKKKACSLLYSTFKDSFREPTMLRCFELIDEFGINSHVHSSEIAAFLGVTSARASQLIKQLYENGCIIKNEDRTYSFICD
ncbi:MAG: DNA (cytosine-5-)-methyltransferase [Oscillospiraceae bacterium]|nr:DNA (cytosine-5-)-methyltransferase [Oscillospiraceae bacterium]